jgi:hypothetical protein
LHSPIKGKKPGTERSAVTGKSARYSILFAIPCKTHGIEGKNVKPEAQQLLYAPRLAPFTSPHAIRFGISKFGFDRFKRQLAF